MTTPSVDDQLYAGGRILRRSYLEETEVSWSEGWRILQVVKV